MTPEEENVILRELVYVAHPFMDPFFHPHYRSLINDEWWPRYESLNPEPVRPNWLPNEERAGQ